MTGVPCTREFQAMYPIQALSVIWVSFIYMKIYVDFYKYSEYIRNPEKKIVIINEIQQEIEQYIGYITSLNSKN